MQPNLFEYFVFTHYEIKKKFMLVSNVIEIEYFISYKCCKNNLINKILENGGN